MSQVLPDNPEALYGFDPAVPISRKITGSLNPYIDTATHVAINTALAANTDLNLFAQLGSTVGNRMLVSLPAIRLMDAAPGNRDGLGEHALSFQANGPDAGAFICFY